MGHSTQFLYVVKTSIMEALGARIAVTRGEEYDIHDFSRPHVLQQLQTDAVVPIRVEVFDEFAISVVCVAIREHHMLGRRNAGIGGEQLLSHGADVM